MARAPADLKPAIQSHEEMMSEGTCQLGQFNFFMFWPELYWLYLPSYEQFFKIS